MGVGGCEGEVKWNYKHLSVKLCLKLLLVLPREEKEPQNMV